MEPVVFACPACKGKLQLKEPARPGARVKCPKCGHAFAFSPGPAAAATPPDRESRLDALLSRWEALAAKGRDVPAQELCADCPELLAELQHRLDCLRKANAFLAPDDSTPEVPAEQPTQVPAQPPPVGTTEEAEEPPLSHEFLRPAEKPDELGRLGPYRVLLVLGQGGMGRVYRAEEPQLRRMIALKVMLPRYAADAKARKRFLREAQTAASLEHDHIVPIFQVGEDNGVPYLAMPLLKGEPLSARLLRDIRLGIDDVLRFGREIALGLAAAHERGLVHRDIKPGNIWLESVAHSSLSQTSVAPGPSAVSAATDSGPRTTSSRVKILDFGLARTAEKDSDQLTSSGMLLGTPAFMSPEQARGEAVDPRSDLFSLGAVFYQMATGEQPFRGHGTMAVLTSLAIDAPRPPALLNPLIPVALNDLILKLLSKEPQGRPAGAAEVAESLRVIEEQRRLLFQRAAEAARRRRTRQIAVVVGLALFGLAALFFGGTIVRSITNRGELVVEVDDPDVELLVRQNDVVVQDRTRKRSFTLSAGPGEVEVYEPDGVKVTTRRFTITRGERTNVSIDMAQARAMAPIPVRGPPPPPPEAVARAAFGEAVLHHANKETLAAFDVLMEAVPDPAKAPWLAEPHRGKIIDMTRDFLATLARDPELAAQSVAKVDSRNFPRCIHGLPIALYFLDKAPPTDTAAQAMQLDCRVHRVLALMQTRSPEADKIIGELLGDRNRHGDLKQRFGPAARALFLAREQYPSEEKVLTEELALGYDLFLRVKQLPAWLKLVESQRDQSGEELKQAWAKQAEQTRTEINRRPPVVSKPGTTPPPAYFLFEPAQARPYQEAAAKELGVPVETVNSIGLKLVLIPAATVMKDSKHFHLGMYEVTQEQYEKVMGRNPSSNKAGPTHPVEGVSWYDAVAFCNQLSEKEGKKTYYDIDNIQKSTAGEIKSAEVKVLGGEGYRLPSANEWEFACRAGTATAYHFGDDEAQLKEYGWYADNSGKKSHPVGELKPNGFGLYDMHGNVWEWCEDLAGPLRGFRGGGWYYSASNCRSSSRSGYPPASRSYDRGFRLALSSVEGSK